MDIILIAAITADGFMARKGDDVIDWSMDLRLFKEQTMGYPVIMGSNTAKTLAVDLKGRKNIIVRRQDSPGHILEKISGQKCFVIGGGRTNTKLAKYLTHLYLTPHPIIFSSGIKLFTELNTSLSLEHLKTITVNQQEGIYQYQYKVINRS